MKVREESSWQHHLSEFANDPDPRALVFCNFVIAWADAAQEALDDPGFEDPSDRCNPAWALRMTLKTVEKKQGQMPLSFVGAALNVLYTHWEFGGDDLYNGLTSIEKRLFEYTAAMKEAALKEQAAQEVDA